MSQIFIQGQIFYLNFLRQPVEKLEVQNLKKKI